MHSAEFQYTGEGEWDKGFGKLKNVKTPLEPPNQGESLRKNLRGDLSLKEVVNEVCWKVFWFSSNSDSSGSIMGMEAALNCMVWRGR